MDNTHTTRDGVTMLVANMEDSHLLNTIKLLCKDIEQNRLVLISDIEETSIDYILSWYDLWDLKEFAKNKIRNGYNNILIYVLEASIRWLDISTQLQEAFWRKDLLSLPY